MYSTTEAYKQAINNQNRTYKISGSLITDNGVEIIINDSNVLAGTMSIDQKCVSNDSFELGNTYISQLQFQLKSDIDRYELFNAKINISYFLLLADGTYEEVPLGVFIINECNRNGSFISITAYDNLSLLDKTISTVTTGTPYQILNFIAENCGIELSQTEDEVNALSPLDNDDNVIEYNIPEDSYETFRDVTGDVAIILGGFCIADRYGKLKIIQFVKKDTKVIPYYQRTTTNISDYQCKYTGFSLTVKNKNYYNGNATGQVLTMENLPLVNSGLDETIQQVVNHISSIIVGYEYTPYTFVYSGDPSIDLGDYVECSGGTLKNGEVFTSVIMTNNFKYKGKQTFAAIGRNPKLSSVQSKTSKEISDIINQAEESRFNVLTYFNSKAYDIANNNKDVVSLSFTVSKDVIPMLTGQIVLNVTNPGTFDITYKINDSELSYKPSQITTCNGKWLINMISPITNTEKGIQNILDIYIKSSDGGTATIDVNAINTMISSANLVSGGKWNGILRIEEQFTCIKINDNSFNDIEDTFNIDFLIPKKTNLNETIPLYSTDNAYFYDDYTPLQAILTVDNYYPTVNTTINLTTNATGGCGANIYTFVAMNVTTGQWEVISNSKENTATYTTSGTDIVDFYCDVTDISEVTTRTNTIVTNFVNTLTIVNSLINGDTYTEVNRSLPINFKAIASGGTSPYTYSWLMHNVNINSWFRATEFISSNTFTWNNATASDAERRFYCEVKDSTGTIIRSEYTTVIVNSSSLYGLIKINDSTKNRNVVANEEMVLSIHGYNGSGTYTYTYKKYNGAKWTTILSNTTETSINITTPSSGYERYVVVINDGTTTVDSNKITLTTISPIDVTSKILTTSGDNYVNNVISTPVSFKGYGGGGCSPYTYSFLFYNRRTNSWHRATEFSTNDEYTWLGDGVAVREFYVESKDYFDTITRSEYITVNTTNLLYATLKANGTTVNKTLYTGDTLILNIESDTNNGITPFYYQFAKIVDGTEEVIQSYSENSQYSCQITKNGTYNYIGYVKDSNNTIVASNTITVLVIASVGALSGTLKINNSTAAINTSVGTSLTLSASATGGSGNYTYKYVVHNLDANTWYTLKDYSSATTYISKISSTGNKEFVVSVKDGSGTIVTTNKIKVSAVSGVLSGTLKVNNSTSTITTSVGTSLTLSASATGGSGEYM